MAARRKKKARKTAAISALGKIAGKAAAVAKKPQQIQSLIKEMSIKEKKALRRQIEQDLQKQDGQSKSAMTQAVVPPDELAKRKTRIAKQMSALMPSKQSMDEKEKTSEALQRR
tara:strand:- start:40 stop:381 length:342 start_codon:yes stop_codon:yes gene_type:complete